MNIAILGFMVLLTVLLIVIYRNSKKLEKKIMILEELLAVKDTTISNLQASRVAVKDVLENLSAHEEVMRRIATGESRESISKTLGIALNKIELIVKFDKIKKESA